MTTERQRLERLTSIRGFAALFVILYHAQEMIGGFDLRPWTALLSKGYLAVDFFFVLSGFILAYSYAHEFDRGNGRYRRFLNNRLARIYPVHLLTLLLAIVVTSPISAFGRLPDGAALKSFLHNVLLSHSWGFVDDLSFNFPSWSISTEWFAYLSFPVLLFVSRLAAGKPWLGFGAALGCIAAFGLIVSTIENHHRLGVLFFRAPKDPAAPFDIFIGWGMLRVGLEFLAGLFLYRAFERWQGKSPAWLGPLSAVLFVVLLAMLHVRWPGHWVLQDTLAVCLTAVLVFSAAVATGKAGSLLEHRWLVYTGEISYTIYMLHAVVLMAYMRLHRVGVPATDTLLGGTLVVLACMLVIVLGSVAIYEWVEKPARALLRRWST